MKVRKETRKVFVADDGAEFRSIDAALKHEFFCLFHKHYSGGSTILVLDIAVILARAPEQFIELLAAIEKERSHAT